MGLGIKNISFTKMHGSGNDFIIIDNRKKLLSEEKIISLAPRLCDRRFGIGADGIITLQPAELPPMDFTMFYRNADGSDAGMCGNGARCLALLAARNGLGKTLKFNVHDKFYKAEVKPDNQVKIEFPFQVEIAEIELEGGLLFQLYTGTEHVVKQLSSAALSDEKLLIENGSKLRSHSRFKPQGTNVNFICGISKNTLRIQTYEKGVENLTLACGTGAIASALVWHRIQKLSLSQHHTFLVKAEGGTLQVGFTYKSKNKFYSDISLSGEACFVFRGNYEL